MANDNININATNTIKKIKKSGIETINIETAFYLAVENEIIDIIKLFLENKKLDINCMNQSKDKYRRKIVEQTPLYMAVEKGSIEVINILLNDDRLDINIINKLTYNKLIQKRTSLHLAVLKENVDIINLLLGAKGVDANIKDEQGRKPVECASEDIKQMFNDK